MQVDEIAEGISTKESLGVNGSFRSKLGNKLVIGNTLP
jgi:hypothetical protein